MPSPLRKLDEYADDPITKKPRRVKVAAYVRHQGKREKLRRVVQRAKMLMKAVAAEEK